ncbi:MAG: hypothetical protein OXF06_08490, partial [Bacteroidetes bacterium]|nr:hypothetical protein [Bacteroidota bacterium]
ERRLCHPHSLHADMAGVRIRADKSIEAEKEDSPIRHPSKKERHTHQDLGGNSNALGVQADFGVYWVPHQMIIYP